MEILNLCLTNNIFKNNILILPRLENKEYANCINKYKAFIVTPGIIDNDYFIVKKFYEIPYTGALLLIYTDLKNKNYLDNLGFINNINCIICYTIKELEKNIEFVLDEYNNGIIDIIRKNGKELIKNNYTVSNISKKIIALIEKNE
jgi:hypothetical protein